MIRQLRTGSRKPSMVVILDLLLSSDNRSKIRTNNQAAARTAAEAWRAATRIGSHTGENGGA